MATATLRGLWRVVRPPRGRTQAAPQPVVLEQGAVWSHRVRAGALRLTCQEGLLWLTCEGEARDTVLAAEGSVRVERPGLVVVQALRSARFAVCEEGPLR